MLKEKDVIKVKLTTYGTLEVVCIPVNLNKDSYKFVKLQCMVPKTENSKDDAILKVYSSTIDETGKVVWNSETYSLPYKETITIRNFEYEVYEDDLPREFCFKRGDLTLTFCYCTINEDGTITSLLPSQNLNLYIGFVGGAGFNENGIKISDYDATVANVNRLNKQIATKAEIDETFLRYDVERLPEKITYNKEGFKTPVVIYQNAQFDIPGMEGNINPQLGNLIVTNSISADNIVQVETFIYKDNIAQRTLVFSCEKELISAEDWSIKVDRKQNKSHAGEFLYVDKNGNINFTKALKDLITKSNGEVLTNDTSAFDFSSIFEIVMKDKEEVFVDGSVELKSVLKSIDYDLETAQLKLARFNAEEFVLQLPTKLSQFENDTEFITKEVDNLTNYVLKDQVGNKLSFSLDQDTFILTINLLNNKDEIISTGQVDFPLESMIIDGRYENGYVYLMLKSGTEISFSIASLISGLVPSTRKINGQTLDKDIDLFIPTYLSSLYQDSKHRTVTDEEKATWNNKSNFDGDYNSLTNKPYIPEGAVIDAELSESSINSVQNKVVTKALNNKLTIKDSVLNNGCYSTQATINSGAKGVVCYAEDKFIKISSIGGSNSKFATSIDGKNWTTEVIVSDVNGQIREVAYGNDVFVALDNYHVLLSNDCKTWETIIDFECSSSGAQIGNLAFGNSVFVICGKSTSIKPKYSTDGRIWNDITDTLLHTNDTFSISFDSTLKQFILAQRNYPYCMFSSKDGVTWSAYGASRFGGVLKVAMSDKHLLYIDNSMRLFKSTKYPDLASSNASDWQEINFGNSYLINDLQYLNNIGLFVVTRQNGDVLYSSDGEKWLKADFLDPYGKDISVAYNIATNNSIVVISGNGDLVQTIMLENILDYVTPKDLIKVDNALSKTSENPVQNKIITEALNSVATKDELNEKASKLNTVTTDSEQEITGKKNFNKVKVKSLDVANIYTTDANGNINHWLGFSNDSIYLGSEILGYGTIFLQKNTEIVGNFKINGGSITYNANTNTFTI